MGAPSCAVEQVMDFFVGRLRKIVVPQAHSPERLGRLGADDVVGDIAKRVAGLR
jgi:hypothetical protein